MGKTQSQVVKEWMEGSVLTESSRGNLYATGATLWHYGTIAAIRTLDGAIIVNTQDWATGFATLPSFPTGSVKTRLPLTSLIIAGIKTHSITILEGEEWGSSCLFSVGEVFYLYGIDDSRPFIVELPAPVSNIEDAVNSLKPDIVKRAETLGREIKRQGDIFLIDSQWDREPDNPITIQHTEYRKIKDGFSDDATGRHHTKKRRWMPQIMDREGNPTRHSVDHHYTQTDISEFGRTAQIVSGHVRHPEHPTIRLKGWWYAVPNMAKRSIRVERRGGRGGD